MLRSGDEWERMKSGLALALALVAAAAVGVGCAGTLHYRDAESPGSWSIPVASSDHSLADEVKRHYAGQHVAGEYMLYVDKPFELSRVEAIASIPQCDDFVRRYFTSMLHAMPDRPPLRFRQRVELVFPPAATVTAAPEPAGEPPRFRAVPPELIAPSIVSAPTPHLPEAARSRDATVKVGQYVVYVDLDGSAPRVDVITSIPGGDESVVATLKTWRFKPRAERVRFLRRFGFSAP